MESIIECFYNLLNKNGILCIIDLDKEDGTFHINNKNFNGHNGFEHRYMKNVLKNSGFSNIKVKTFYYSQKKYNNMNIPYSMFYAIGKK